MATQNSDKKIYLGQGQSTGNGDIKTLLEGISEVFASQLITALQALRTKDETLTTAWKNNLPHTDDPSMENYGLFWSTPPVVKATPSDRIVVVAHPTMCKALEEIVAEKGVDMLKNMLGDFYCPSSIKYLDGVDASKIGYWGITGTPQYVPEGDEWRYQNDEKWYVAESDFWEVFFGCKYYLDNLDTITIPKMAFDIRCAGRFNGVFHNMEWPPDTDEFCDRFSIITDLWGIEY